jgi:6-phosphogluconate dehydrogenase
MELGMIGLGRLGPNMVRRLLPAGHQCVVYDLQPEAVQALAKDGAVGTTSLADFANKLKLPRDESGPAPVLSAALHERFSAHGEDDFACKVLSALRYQFGGHEEKAADKKKVA